MAEALRLLESGRDAAKEALRRDFAAQSLPVQDRIIEQRQLKEAKEPWGGAIQEIDATRR